MSLLAVESVTGRRSVCSQPKMTRQGSELYRWGKLIEIKLPSQEQNWPPPRLICNRLILSQPRSTEIVKDSFSIFFFCKYLLFTIVRISCNINTTARTQHTKRGQETLILPSYSWLMGIYGGLEKNWTLDKNDNKPFLNWLIHYLNYY